MILKKFHLYININLMHSINKDMRTPGLEKGMCSSNRNQCQINLGRWEDELNRIQDQALHYIDH